MSRPIWSRPRRCSFVAPPPAFYRHRVLYHLGIQPGTADWYAASALGTLLGRTPLSRRHQVVQSLSEATVIQPILPLARLYGVRGVYLNDASSPGLAARVVGESHAVSYAR